MSDPGTLVGALQSLGFSSYEARTYTGLLQGYGQTAYALSKSTGVPQPKIYEALRRLEVRGAAVLVGTDPQKYSATPPEELLNKLRAEFQVRMDDAETAVSTALAASSFAQTTVPEVVNGLRGRETVVGLARDLIDGAQGKVYLSAWRPELTDLADSINGAARRGVEFVVLCFGKGRLSLDNAQVIRHMSTIDSLYPSHRNRHFASVVDGEHVLWATSVDRAEWSGIGARDRRLVGLVRSYIRHDIYVQKIYSRLGPELKDMFGPGLELLTNLTQDVTMSDVRAAQDSPAEVSETAI